MKLEFIVTPEEFLKKIAPVNWFRDQNGTEDEKRYKYAMDEMQRRFPGNYVLEEAYDPVSMSFKYRLKFLTEADEMWFRLKYQ